MWNAIILVQDLNSAEMLLVYSTVPAEWADRRRREDERIYSKRGTLNYFIYQSGIVDFKACQHIMGYLMPKLVFFKPEKNLNSRAKIQIYQW